MQGRHLINIISRKAEYHLELERKITVIKGDSGTGKSSMIRLISQYLELGRDSGVKLTVSSSAKIQVLTNMSDWYQVLEGMENTILFIDENVRCLYDENFQRALWNADCYAVIVSRSGMFTALPYAVLSIYELQTKQNGKTTVTSMYRLYENQVSENNYDLVITEDSNSGYEMAEYAFSAAAGENPVKVVSANGNSNVPGKLRECSASHRNICVDVDGAAFGPYIEQTLKYAELTENTKIAAPESFEYLLLQNGDLIRFLTPDSSRPGEAEELTRTFDFCNSRDFITWERYYEKLIEKITAEHLGFQYTKRRLNPYFKTLKYAEQYLEDLGKCYVRRADERN